MDDFKIPKGTRNKQDLRLFAEKLEEISQQIGFKVSARGWAYQLEQFGLVTKAEFDVVENVINKCRKNGYLPVNFTAEEDARKFSGVEKEEDCTPIGYVKKFLEGASHCEVYYTPYWWKNEKYYIQMLVEKVDLKTLFKPVCESFHIPIATAKGWSSILQRAEYARRFKEAEEMGLKCVLLYCGDHDPDGLRISEFIRKNLFDISNIVWSDKETGYDPTNLIIDRFGLNYDFIIEHNLTWIDNLITGSKRNLASPDHKNHYMPYVQEYLHTIDERKCEANAIVPMPKEAGELVRGAIEKYVGDGALERFDAIRQEIVDDVVKFRKTTGLDVAIEEAIRIIDEEGDA